MADTTAAATAAATTAAAPPPPPPSPPSITDAKYGPYTLIQSYKTAVDASIGVLQGLNQTIDTALVTDYTTLKTEIEATLNAWPTTDLSTLNSKESDYSSRKDALGKRLDAVKPKQDALGAGDAVAITAKRTAERVLDLFFWIAAIFGGIINSHIFLNKTSSSLIMRLYYWVFGFAFFPIVLFYALYDPPAWRAALFPWFDRENVPPAMNSTILKPLTILVMFRKPGIGETDFGQVTRNMLRFISMGLLAGICIIYLMVNGTLPIPSA